jgi:transmembrane sensor
MKRDRTLHEAARHFARLQAHDCSQQERADIAAWEQQGQDQRRASLLARRVASDVDRLAASVEYRRKLEALAAEAFDAYAQSRADSRATPVRCAATARSWRWSVGLAASLAVAAVAWHAQSGRSAHETRAGIRETAGPQRREVTLADGSVVELDVESSIVVRLSAQRREIELVSGRAFFEVAHDASRPFTVTANGARTTALGTQFQVEASDSRVVVTLTEGAVSVDGGEQRPAKTVWQERLHPGDQLSIDTTTAERSMHSVDPHLVTSWTHGRHVFRGTPLRAALDEVNRYASRKVRLGDASLAELPVAGNFVAGDSELVVAAFAAVLPLRVVDGGDREIILFRRYAD